MAEIQLRNVGKRWGSFVGVDNYAQPQRRLDLGIERTKSERVIARRAASTLLCMPPRPTSKRRSAPQAVVA